MWIRIADTLPTDPKTLALGRACQVPTPTAVGMVVLVLLQLPHHAEDGDLAHVPPEAVEAWAMWPGEPGVFDAAFRRWFCDDTGLVRAWDKHNGHAIRERTRKQQANTAPETRPKASAARNPRNISAENPGIRAENSDISAERAGIRAPTYTSTYTNTASASATARGDDPPDAPRPFDPASDPASDTAEPPPELTDPDQRAAWGGVLRAARSPAAVAASIAAVQSGMQGDHGQSTPWPVVGAALLEMAAVGVGYSPATLRGYIRRLQAPAPTSRVAVPRGSPIRTDAEREVTWDEVATQLGVTLPGIPMPGIPLPDATGGAYAA